MLKYFTLVVILIAALAGLGFFLCCGTLPQGSTLSNSVYVWQTTWSSPVIEATREIAPSVDSLMVFAGTFDARGEKIRYISTRIDWETLKQVGKPVSVVVRADAGLANHLAAGEIDTAAATFAAELTNLIDDADAEIQDVQLDYDCPTSKLADYAKLLGALNRLLPNVNLAVTALPTWLSSGEFKDLLPPLRYYVLQVHSLGNPAEMTSPTICDTTKIADWVRHAGKFKKPFYVALPTYGYRLYLDSTGAVATVTAEGPSRSVSANNRTVEVLAEPFEIAPVVRELRNHTPRHCKGVAWFRMPVETDDLNWSWPTLRAVMAGQEPSMTFTADIRKPRDDLYEIWMANTGDFQPSRPLRVVVSTAHLLAYDCVGGYSGEPGSHPSSLVLTGPAPERGEEVMAAWCVIEPGTEFSVGNAEVIQ